MSELAERPSTAGQRLGAPESFGVSTLEPGLRPPAQPPGRQVSIRVQMLDDTQEVFQISQRAPGKVLFDLVCVHLNLTEGDYFGLEYTDHRKMTVWLDLLKPALKQIRRPKNTILRFVVKFFPPDHTQLMEELTRYLFALQIKRDLACGRLICNDTSAALMVSHIIQSEIGDFDETQSWQHLLHNKYLPDQDTSVSNHGRTQKQIIDHMKDSELKKVPFERKHSKVLSSSSMSPRSSSFRSQVATSVPLSDQPDSARLEARANGTEERPAIAPPTNGFPPDSTLNSDTGRQNHNGAGQHLLNPGPTCRANKGSSSSIPYIDCSDIDSECDAGKSGRAPRGHGANDSNDDDSYRHAGGAGSRDVSLFGVVNGFYHTNQQGVMQQGLPGDRHAVDQTQETFNASQGRASDEVLSNGGSFQSRLPLHSTLLDEIFQGRDKRGAGIVRPLGTGTRSQCSSPVIGSFHPRTNSLSHGEMTNGHSQPRSASRWDDGGHYFSKRPGHAAVEAPGFPPSSHPPNHYGSYSPVVSNRTPPPHFTKPYNLNNNTRDRSDTDPFILSQLTSTPVQRDPYRPGMQTPCSAPTERKATITNGNPAFPGQARSHASQRVFGRQGKPNNNNNTLSQPVQMIDGSTSSGTDTSDTESDTGSSAYSQPLLFGNPAVVGSDAGKLPFGSLPPPGEGGDGERERRYRLSEEDVGGQVFSC
uniref:FERM domain-containing protein n=1 Tax=Fundulus heteroclitus TaxID=8078 RepID=A0A3Q2NVA2_FUNHE